ncbi:MAG TPA: NUDIX domain-containing protein [Planctomycetota bacterium]|nr:NUDIX domain-containing protein [Planctomycetota bacterium]
MNTPATQQTILIVSGALFSAEGKLLLLRRADDKEWEMPGGELDFGEAPELGLIRQFSETTDIEVSVDRPLGAWSSLESTGDRAIYTVHIDFTVKCSGALLGVDIDPSRHAEFAWMSRPQAAASMPLPAKREAVERAFVALTRSRKNA